MSRFIPLTDELIYDHPERIPRDGTTALVPFHLDLVDAGSPRTRMERQPRSAEKPNAPPRRRRVLGKR